MSAAARRVRSLRLRAERREAVPRVLPAVEDALCTATLPDAGGRLLLVRRLALGRIAEDAAPASIALALERAMAEARLDCRDAREPAAAQAAAVWFADPLAAHVALARRLLEGPPPREWFWPLAVPGWSAALPVATALQSLARSLAARPEAAVALPAWIAELGALGHAPRLRAALGSLGMSLPAAAGEPVTAESPRSAVRVDQLLPERRPQAFAPSPVEVTPGSPLPGVAASTDLPEPPAAIAGDRRTEVVARAAGTSHAAVERPAPRAGVAAIDTPASAAPLGRSGTDSALPAPPPRAASEARVVASPAPIASPEDSSNATLAQRAQQARSRLAQAPFEGLPTEAGGIAFLLPLLARLGYPQWLEAAPDWADQHLAARLLGAVLRRLAIAADDPAWALAGVADHGQPQPSSPPPPAPPPPAPLLPASWAGLARRDGRRPLQLDLQASAPPLDAQLLALWLRAAHRTLRRHAGLGFAALVRRPARLTCSSTHLDLRFDLADVDLRIRRAGLDLDPGWLPWYGRVVGFHYQRLRG